MATATPTPTLVPTGTWVADAAHSKAGFSVKHMGITTRARRVHGIRGARSRSPTTSPPPRPTARQGSAPSTPTRSIATTTRSPDFFDAEAYPEMTFASTRIEAVDDETFDITGDLTLHGVTQEIVLHAEVQGTDVDPWGNDRVGLEVTGQLSRGDYGMRFNQALGSGNMVVSDKVKLALDVSAVRQA